MTTGAQPVHTEQMEAIVTGAVTRSLRVEETSQICQARREAAALARALAFKEAG